jgi:hypothetical protein
MGLHGLLQGYFYTPRTRREDKRLWIDVVESKHLPKLLQNNSQKEIRPLLLRWIYHPPTSERQGLPARTVQAENITTFRKNYRCSMVQQNSLRSKWTVKWRRSTSCYQPSLRWRWVRYSIRNKATSCFYYALVLPKIGEECSACGANKNIYPILATRFFLRA